MTKKHFEAAAQIVREKANQSYSKAGRDAAVMVDAFEALFTQFCPRFDSERFRAACYRCTP